MDERLGVGTGIGGVRGSARLPCSRSLVEVGVSFDTGSTRSDALGSGLDDIPPGSV